MSKVVVYIDGFNLYYGIKSKSWDHLFWLNPKLLAENIAKSNQQIMCVKYFTARFTQNSKKQQNQVKYFEAIETLDAVDMFFGKYQLNPHTCPKCSNVENLPSEKMTDVNIAVELLADAYENNYDTALLVSADSDLTGPIKKVKALFPDKKVICFFPPGRSSKELMKVSSGFFHISKTKLTNSQFDDTVISKNGVPLQRPQEWK